MTKPKRGPKTDFDNPWELNLHYNTRRTRELDYTPGDQTDHTTHIVCLEGKPTGFHVSKYDDEDHYKVYDPSGDYVATLNGKLDFVLEQALHHFRDFLLFKMGMQ